MKPSIALLIVMVAPVVAADSLFVAFPRETLSGEARQKVGSFLVERTVDGAVGRFTVCSNTVTHGIWLVDSLWVEHLEGRDKVLAGVALLKAALSPEANVVVELTADPAGWMEKLHLVPLGGGPETVERW